ncbi:MAG: YeeE/YedE thiosulfate transporter family protein, partial [Thioalkalispiraceae bacterium]
MSFESFFEAQSFFLWSTFIIAFIMGAVVNKTNFCTMGAVSDLVNMGDSGRMRAWILASTVAVIGVIIIESMGAANLSNTTLPPYRGSEFQWGRYILGGILFGIGMTLASGCGNKTLIRIGGGNIKSIFVFVVIAVIAYFMVDP